MNVRTLKMGRRKWRNEGILGGILRFLAEENELLCSNLFRSADLIPVESTIENFQMKNTL